MNWKPRRRNSLGFFQRQFALLHRSHAVRALLVFAVGKVLRCGIRVASLDAAAVSAMLDRLLHHGHVLKCGPRSWRTKTDLPPQEATG